MNDTFMKEKPIFPLLTSMALPMVISMLVNALYNIVDSLFVARISEEAMTALSLVYPVQNLINAIAIGFSVGISALISLHMGAGNKEKADTAATHGMVLSLIHGVIISIVCTAIMPHFLRSFTSDESVIAMGLTYSRIAFMFAVVIMAAMSFEKIFQAVGRMNVTMIGLMGGSVCNIILDPLLIFGIGPFPEMGIAGAALATGIGQLVPVVFYLIVYNVRPIPVKLRRACLRADAKLDLPAVRHRRACYPEFGAAFGAYLLPEWTAGGVLPELCCGAGHLLQIADFPVSARQRHCAGPASHHWLQLRRRGV